MQVSINPKFNGFIANPEIEFRISNCTFNGLYRHGTRVNGKIKISAWTKRFVLKSKYNI